MGVSAVCILGLNKNRGQEISLRLRTDDYAGFRKYRSIQHTLVHELAHMVSCRAVVLSVAVSQEGTGMAWHGCHWDLHSSSLFIAEYVLLVCFLERVGWGQHQVGVLHSK